MELGLIGLGKMGGNMRERLRRAGHTVVGYDRNPEVSDVESVAAMVEKLQAPRAVWVMVPAGEVTRSVVEELAEVLDSGEVVFEGVKSRWTEDLVEADVMAAKGIG
jgi:6-phosphogluconate dehydrogenase